jgi:hypothetical protein
VPNRFDVYEPLSTIGKTTPADAVVLAHDMNRPLGIDRQWVADASQTRFSYARLRTPAAIHRELTGLGVTHLVWPDHIPEVDSLLGEFSFLNYAIGYTLDQRSIGGYTIGRLPPRTPDDGDADFRVALFGCRAPYRQGWYRLSQLTLPVVDPGPAPFPEATVEGLSEALERADLIVVDASCHGDLQPGTPFGQGAQQGNNHLYLRTKPSQK